MNSETLNYLIRLGFSKQEADAYEMIAINGGKFTPAYLQRFGYSAEEARRLAYMNKIVQGSICITNENDMISHVKKMSGVSRETAQETVYRQNLSNGYGAQNYTEEELRSHLKKTNGKYRKISVQDLEISRINSIPRVAVIAGIDVEPYTIWNSKQYKGKEALYKVVDVTTSNITIETSRKPKIKWGTSTEIDGMLKIIGVKDDGKAVVSFNKNYCRLCNRFAIVASLKNPEFHLGKYSIMCFEGTRVYVFAINIGTKENIHYNSNSQRVYAYGILPGDINGKLSAVAKQIYEYIGGVAVNVSDATAEYSVMPKVNVNNTDDSEGIIV